MLRILRMAAEVVRPDPSLFAMIWNPRAIVLILGVQTSNLDGQSNPCAEIAVIVGNLTLQNSCGYRKSSNSKFIDGAIVQGVAKRARSNFAFNSSRTPYVVPTRRHRGYVPDLAPGNDF